MTTGSSRDDFRVFEHGGWTGSDTYRSWSGEDRPVVPKPQPTLSTYVSRGKWNRKGKFVIKTYQIKTYSRPPKRLRDVDHPFTKNYLRQASSPVLTQYYSDGSPNGGRMTTDGPVVMFGDWATAALLDSNDEFELINRLREQIAGSDFNMSVFLGEGREALSLIGDTAIRIASAMRETKKLNLTGAARHLLEGTGRRPLPSHDWVVNRPLVPTAKNLASLWLELQYGWLPLLSDTVGAAQMLAHHLEVPAVMRYRASIGRKSIYSRVDGTPFNGATVPHQKYHRRSIIARVSEDPLTIPQLLGLTNPENVAWELLPFSFVADWFFPIGDFLEARSFASKLRGTFVYSDKQLAIAGPPRYTDWVPTQSATVAKKLVFNRTITSALEVPMPKFKPLSQALSYGHCQNAIALLTGAFSSRRTA